MEARDSARLSAGELAAGHAADCKDDTRASLGVSDDHGATGEDTRQESKAAAVEDFRRRRSLEALYGNDFTEHSKSDRQGRHDQDYQNKVV